MRARNIIIFLVVIALGVGAYFVFFNKQPGISQAELDAQKVAQEASQTGQNAQSEVKNPVTAVSSSANLTTAAPAKVTVSAAGQDGVSYIETLGTIKAKEQIRVLPQTSGQLVVVNVKEGDYVKTGDVLFVIGGTNGRQHATTIATQVAETNLATAQKALTAAINGNAASLRASELQLESANHALQGTYTDLSIMDRNMQGMDQGYTLTTDSWQRTIEKNSLDLEKIDYGLNQLRDGINALENSRYSLEVTKKEQLAKISDETARKKAEAEFNTQLAAFDTKINDLYAQLDMAKIGYESAMVALPITENQGQAAIITTDTQRDVLAMQQLSAQQKLGMLEGSSDPVRLAQVGLEGTRIKNDLTLAQAKAAVELAKLNLELSKTQKEALWVKAPTDGIVTDVTASIGDLVSPQVAITTIINPRQFELKVAVDADSADRIRIGSMGQVKIGGRYIDIPVSSVAPIVDSTSRLVSVTLKLPKILFRPNQSLSAKIPVPNQIVASNGSGVQQSYSAVSVPLDAVIIGTEEQYLYVLENGKARKRTVKLGDINGSQVQVLEGVTSNDRIIVEGAKSLTDGQSVQA